MPLHPAIKLLVICLCLGMIAPIVIVAILSFSGSGYLQFPPKSLSLQWYGQFFGDPAWQRALWSSLAVGAMACLVASVVGFMGAYALVRGRFQRKKLLLSVVLLPLIVPHIITSIALYFISAPLNLVGSKPWIAVCHAVVSLPMVVMILMSALQNVDENLERAALSLGASRLTVYRRVVIPLALPGILSSALFSFLASFDELMIAMFLAGVGSETLPVRIWNSLRMDVEPTIAAVSTFLIAITLVVLLVDNSLRRLRQA